MKPLLRLATSTVVKVSELINSENWTWRIDRVRAQFIPPDAEAILNIPLRSGGGGDF